MESCCRMACPAGGRMLRGDGTGLRLPCRRLPGGAAWPALVSGQGRAWGNCGSGAWAGSFVRPARPAKCTGEGPGFPRETLIETMSN
jgi:hypothetical protein